MLPQKKVLIIGSGVAGIATSIFLARKGFLVEIFEKNANPGGRCGQMTRDGHRFDLGATLLLMPSIYKEVFDALELDLEKELEAEALNPIYKLFFGDNSSLSYSQDTEKMKSQLEAMESGSSRPFEEYVEEGYGFFKLGMKRLLNRNFYHFFQFINLKNAWLMIRLKAWIKHSNYIKRYFKDPRLQKAFTFQNIYVGQNPYRQPAFFSMVSASEIKEGALFPKGGMHTIAKKLMERAEELGVKIHLKKEVKQIIVNADKTEGILLADGERIESDIVIANADLPYVYDQLLPDKKAAAKLKKKDYSCSAIVFHWGIDKTYPELAQHSIFLNEPYKEGMEMIFDEKSISANPSFYIHSPGKTDPSAAPEGEDSWSVIVPAGHVEENIGQDWDELKQRARTAIIRRLTEIGISDIEEHIKFETCFTPQTWVNYCNVSKGSVFGSISHKIFQMGYFRPHNRHEKYKNLYFVGGSTHPGNGVPLVLLSSKLTSERIIKEEFN